MPSSSMAAPASTTWKAGSPNTAGEAAPGPDMAMFELVLSAPQALVEPVSDALMDELGALSVSVEDADAETDAEHALFGEPGMPAPQPGWERSTLKALFDSEAAATDAMTLLLAQDWAEGLAMQSLQQV